MRGPLRALRGAWFLVRDATQKAAEDQVMRLGASLAYYTVLSLAPLVVVVIGFAGVVWNTAELRAQLMRQVSDLVGDLGAQVVGTVLANASESGYSGWAAALGTATLLFAATTVFAELQGALNIIWKAKEPGRGAVTFLRKRVISLGVVITMVLALLVSMVASTVVVILAAQVRGGLPLLWRVLDHVGSWAIYTGAFALTFKILPDARTRWRPIWIGAAITAVLFLVGKNLIGLYVERAAGTSSFGAAGTLFAFLLWLHFSAVLFYWGAELTHTLAERDRARRQEPDDEELSHLRRAFSAELRGGATESS